MQTQTEIPPTVAWVDGWVRLIDQRRLPARLRFLDCGTVDELCAAIDSLAVRGAPALGAAGGYGVALAVRRARSEAGAYRAAEKAAEALIATRPTAVNLAWGALRVLEAARAVSGSGVAAVRRAALDEANAIAAEDVAANRALGAHGAELVPQGASILTHCNAGALACVGYGTAVGVIRAAAEAGKAPRVWVDETRPVLQGARLTAWELKQLGIPSTLVADSMAGSLMAAGDVDLVVVGADRVAANGDVANKIGTYPLAVLAAHHGVPFYVAAPTSTVDMTTATGAGIPVEERDPLEVTRFGRQRVAPARARALNRAFDVTPAGLVTALITERGVARPPYPTTLRKLLRARR
ncbi:MAG: S-methyl-5-thioribose-1-phosphate isomerase [Acidimicrobiia bacterium]